MFFANSGVSWPKLQGLTRNAGRDALGAASDLWDLLRTLEEREWDDKESGEERGRIVDCVRNLTSAAKSYRDVAREIGGPFSLRPLTSAEVELAAIAGVRYYEFGPYLGRLFFDGPIDVYELYRELIERLELLASQLQAFEPSRNRKDLAPQVFKFMQQWETIAIVARIIAVINRRQPESARG